MQQTKRFSQPSITTINRYIYLKIPRRIATFSQFTSYQKIIIPKCSWDQMKSPSYLLSHLSLIKLARHLRPGDKHLMTPQYHMKVFCEHCLPHTAHSFWNQRRRCRRPRHYHQHHHNYDFILVFVIVIVIVIVMITIIITISLVSTLVSILLPLTLSLLLSPSSLGWYTPNCDIVLRCMGIVKLLNKLS